MTSRYQATVVKVDAVVEEAVVILVRDITLRCFVSYSPSIIEEGKSYEIELEMVLAEGHCISETESTASKIELIGSGFSCEVYGQLDGDTVRSFIDFSDQDLHYEYPYLNGRHVKIKVDRIDVSFFSAG